MSALGPAGHQLRLAERPPGERDITLCLLDEDELLLAGYAYHLGQSSDVSLIASAHGGCTFQSLVPLFALRPHVLMLGVDILSPAAVEAVREASEAHPQTGVLVLVNELGEGSAQAIAALMRRWPAGFACVFKRSMDSNRRLVSLVESVANGHVSTDAAILNRVLGRDEADDWLSHLSPREAEALDLMVEGLSNAAIAEQMHLELKTVERHINSIYSKLGPQAGTGHPRVQAVRAYLEATARGRLRS